MSRSTALILLGVLIILTLFSGLPESWITTLLALFGVIVAFVGVAIRAESVKRAQQATPAVASPTASEPVLDYAAEPTGSVTMSSEPTAPNLNF